MPANGKAGGKNGAELNEHQRRFVEGYMGRHEGNAARAYMEAYGQEDVNVAAALASRLLRVAKVRAEIDSRIADDPLVADRHELQRRLSAIARGEDRGSTLIDEETGKRVDRWGSKVSDEIRAVELLFKTRAELIDNLRVSEDLSRLSADEIAERMRAYGFVRATEPAEENDDGQD